jgi:hypothetical protein
MNMRNLTKKISLFKAFGDFPIDQLSKTRLELMRQIADLKLSMLDGVLTAVA